MEDGVEILTVYAFSTENWSRDSTEVSTLMTIFAKYANNFQKEALSRNIKVDVLSTGIFGTSLRLRLSLNYSLLMNDDYFQILINCPRQYGIR